MQAPRPGFNPSGPKVQARRDRIGAPARGRSSLSAATRPPDEIRAHRVVPNDAEQRAGEPGNPPRLIVFVEPRSDVYIRDRSDAASKRKTSKASDHDAATVPNGPWGLPFGTLLAIATTVAMVVLSRGQHTDH